MTLLTLTCFCLVFSALRRRMPKRRRPRRPWKARRACTAGASTWRTASSCIWSACNWSTPTHCCRCLRVAFTRRPNPSSVSSIQCVTISPFILHVQADPTNVHAAYAAYGTFCLHRSAASAASAAAGTSGAAQHLSAAKTFMDKGRRALEIAYGAQPQVRERPGGDLLFFLATH